MAGMQDVVTAVGENHRFSGALPFQALTDQLFPSEGGAQVPILTWRLRWPRIGGAGPALKDFENVQQLLRIALAAKLVLIDLAEQPVGGGVLILNGGHDAAVERGSSEIDSDHPARRLKGLDGDTTHFFPLAIGLSQVPRLKEFDRCHGS